LEEISADINNLYFNIQILHWAPANPASATGCVFQEIRGDLEKGLINVVQEACPNVYSVHVVDPTNAYQKPGELESNSQYLAQKILSGNTTSVDVLKVFMQPVNLAEEYPLELKRVSP